MDYHFIEGISDIQETEALTGSRTTLPFSPRHFSQQQHDPLQSYLVNQSHFNASYAYSQQQSPSFTQLRQYIEKTLGSWGFKIGYMSQNSQNKMTINCLLQLITQRFKEQENRDNLKQNLSTAVYQRNKYQSLLEQEKSVTAQKNRVIGRLQNAAEQLKARVKQAQLAFKKQKQDDKKLINMLKSKSEQVMHEIKKRQQQINRMKQQMKKNVLSEKGGLKGINFQVYQILQKETNDEINDRMNALTQKYETERKNFMKENLLLRQKIYDIRQGIVQFAEWIDVNLFRQANSCYKNKLIVNHNLLFKKQSLVDELNQILFNAKSGIKDMIDMHQGRLSLRIKSFQNLGEDKTSTQNKNYIENRSPNKQLKQSVDLKKPRETIIIKKKLSVNQVKKQKQQIKLTVPIIKQKIDLCQEQESELSMISHVSAKDILTQNKQFDKWQILFNQ